jgi:hypothetical protein
MAQEHYLPPALHAEKQVYDECKQICDCILGVRVSETVQVPTTLPFFAYFPLWAYVSAPA